MTVTRAGMRPATQAGDDFVLSSRCPPSFELVAGGTCELRDRYQFYDSLQDRGVGGTRTSLPPHRDGFRPEQIDLFRFRLLAAEAGEPSCLPPRRVALLRQAMALWRGDPLTGVSGAWAARTREHLTGELLVARAAWAEAELMVDNPAAVLAPLGALTDAHPLMEPLMVALVRALVAAGRPTDALERCRVHRQRLVEEYGTDQSPELRGLYEEILCGGDPPTIAAAVAPARAGTVEGPDTPARTGTWRADAHPMPSALPVTPGRPTSSPDRRHPLRQRALAVAAAVVCLAVAVTVGAAALYWRAGPSTRPAADARSAVTEDFTDTTLDATRWVAYEMPRANGSAWSPSMVRVRGGELQLSGAGRNPTGGGNLAGAACWCADDAPIHTYGVWEVEAKFDVGDGYGAVIGLYPAVDEDTPGWAFLTMARLDQPARTSMYPAAGDQRHTVTGAPVTGDFTTWNTYAIEWRADFVTISLNQKIIFDTRGANSRAPIPSVPMYLYVQLVPGPDGPVPAPNQDTPSQVVAHVDLTRYTP